MFLNPIFMCNYVLFIKATVSAPCEPYMSIVD